MNCPKCGRPLKEGMLYCEHCGGEVNLVPEFDTQVEQSIAESMQEVMHQGFEEKEPENHTAEENDPAHEKKAAVSADKKRIGKKGIFILPCLLAVAVIILTAIAVTSSRRSSWYASAQQQMISARDYAEDGKYDSAEECYLRAIELEPEQWEYQLELADFYVSQEREDEALQIYRSVLMNEEVDSEVKLQACQGIVDYYSAAGDYRSIAQILVELGDEEVRAAFSDYLAEPVTFSQPEGIFTDSIILKLSADSSGSIYYTLDGTEPDENGELYLSPLYLEEGTTVVSAVYINRYGVKSTVSTATYLIDTSTPYPPELSAYSGKYDYPLEIEAQAEEGSAIYYTVDGGIPDTDSTLYEGGLYAAEGTHTYRFVAVSEAGLVSDVISRTFTIDFSWAEYSSDEAWVLLVNAQIEAGVITDTEGTIADHPEYVYIYQYLFPISLDSEEDAYYLFAEVNRETALSESGAMIQHRTGVYYGIDCSTGQIVRLTFARGRYVRE
ncbi:MAG: chitobiase/beta-hexosaminidase C-terminal domain-containing protein [Lachnospiraceae bacterium]|nr:chitobiase/beta-hexosaminidase C-terminal domain-containing protein [Lachnospiraceae bacterium]